MLAAASGRSSRQSAVDKEAVVAIGGKDMVDFMHDMVETANAAIAEEALNALQAARMQADVAERQAERQFKLEERREDREGEVALHRVRVEEQRMTVQLEKAKSAVKFRSLEILERLY